jgi:tetratricopeptide (TPR) repeat protein
MIDRCYDRVNLYQMDGSMYRSSLFLTAALVGTTVALVQPVVAAISASEVEVIARAVAVEIKLKSDPNAVGSGVIIDRQRDLYTLVTNKHVVCGSSSCSKLPAGEIYSLGLSDGQRYQVKGSSVRLLGDDLQGALADYNQAILLNPKYSVAYYNRAILKNDKLNDRAGAIQDFRQAARLFREQGNNQNAQLAIKLLQRLGATE